MKISCLQENLAKGLSIVGRAVSTRSSLPVLANVLLATDNGRLKLSATNLEIAITCWIGAKVERPGAITVPARTFSDLVNALPTDRVELELAPDSQTLHVNCARTEANIKGIEAETFPLLPDPDPTQSLRLEAAKLKQMVQQVTFAAAVDDTRPMLTGVSLRFAGKQLRLAATDAFRLSVRSAEIPVHVDTPKEVIVPARALNELARVISDSDSFVLISMPEDRNQIIFQLENVVIVSQLIEGSFPDFTAIIPKSARTRSVMGTADFLKACKTADIFARESSHTARMTIKPGNELMDGYATIAATSQETGDNVAQIDANVDGPEIEISFNVRFLTEVLGVMETPQMILETNGPMEPGVLKPMGQEEFLHVIMPMHYGR